MDKHVFDENIERNGMDFLDGIFRNLPEEERTMIEFCAKQSEQGNGVALTMLEKLYAFGDKQAARLYYGAHVGDSYACWKLGGYHLHGKYVFHFDSVLARHFLRKAMESRWPHIAMQAAAEIKCMAAPTADFKLAHYTLERYNGSEEVVFVPSRVKEIGSDAFKNNKTLKKIILPSCVTEIGAGAFSGCENLEMVVLPDDLTVIGWRAFGDCKSLREIALPRSLQVIEDAAFYGCTSLAGITIPENVAEIGRDAFYGSGLKKAVLRTGVRRIGKAAFAYTPLETFVYPETLVEIDANAFKGCGSLSAVYLHAMHYNARRSLTVRRGNDSYFRAIHADSLEESNKYIVHMGRGTTVEELRTEKYLASREKESGYYVRYGESDGMPWLI
ncbi:MAG: leucine-rich repeat domain-containing protein [Oscillospiraceae bacterium]|nr:leucine-rich repeat domain-containing protein [Oscillospiraceae bacterium]